MSDASADDLTPTIILVALKNASCPIGSCHCERQGFDGTMDFADHSMEAIDKSKNIVTMAQDIRNVPKGWFGVNRGVVLKHLAAAIAGDNAAKRKRMVETAKRKATGTPLSSTKKSSSSSSTTKQTSTSGSNETETPTLIESLESTSPKSKAQTSRESEEKREKRASSILGNSAEKKKIKSTRKKAGKTKSKKSKAAKQSKQLRRGRDQRSTSRKEPGTPSPPLYNPETASRDALSAHFLRRGTRSSQSRRPSTLRTNAALFTGSRYMPAMAKASARHLSGRYQRYPSGMPLTKRPKMRGSQYNFNQHATGNFSGLSFAHPSAASGAPTSFPRGSPRMPQAFGPGTFSQPLGAPLSSTKPLSAKRTRKPSRKRRNEANVSVTDAQRPATGSSQVDAAEAEQRGDDAADDLPDVAAAEIQDSDQEIGADDALANDNNSDSESDDASDDSHHVHFAQDSSNSEEDDEEEEDSVDSEMHYGAGPNYGPGSWFPPNPHPYNYSPTAPFLMTGPSAPQSYGCNPMMKALIESMSAQTQQTKACTSAVLSAARSHGSGSGHGPYSYQTTDTWTDLPLTLASVHGNEPFVDLKHIASTTFFAQELGLNAFNATLRPSLAAILQSPTQQWLQTSESDVRSNLFGLSHKQAFLMTGLLQMLGVGLGQDPVMQKWARTILYVVRRIQDSLQASHTAMTSRDTKYLKTMTAAFFNNGPDAAQMCTDLPMASMIPIKDLRKAIMKSEKPKASDRRSGGRGGRGGRGRRGKGSQQPKKGQKNDKGKKGT